MGKNRQLQFLEAGSDNWRIQVRSIVHPCGTLDWFNQQDTLPRLAGIYRGST